MNVLMYSVLLVPYTVYGIVTVATTKHTIFLQRYPAISYIPDPILVSCAKVKSPVRTEAQGCYTRLQNLFAFLHTMTVFTCFTLTRIGESYGLTIFRKFHGHLKFQYVENGHWNLHAIQGAGGM